MDQVDFVFRRLDPGLRLLLEGMDQISSPEGGGPFGRQAVETGAPQTVRGVSDEEVPNSVPGDSSADRHRLVRAERE
jgi:hypothetical protein